MRITDHCQHCYGCGEVRMASFKSIITGNLTSKAHSLRRLCTTTMSCVPSWESLFPQRSDLSRFAIVKVHKSQIHASRRTHTDTHKQIYFTAGMNSYQLHNDLYSQKILPTTQLGHPRFLVPDFFFFSLSHLWTSTQPLLTQLRAMERLHKTYKTRVQNKQQDIHFSGTVTLAQQTQCFFVSATRLKNHSYNFCCEFIRISKMD